MYYVVTGAGIVYRYKASSLAEAQAEATDGFISKDGDVSAIPTATLVLLYNIIRPEKPIKRFADRETAEARMKGVLEVLAKPGPKPDGSVVGSVVGSVPAAPVSSEGAPADAPAGEGSTEGVETPAGSVGSDGSAVPISPEDTTVATKTKKAPAKRAAKKPAGEISDATVRKVIKLRADGTGWPEILKEYDEGVSFIHRIRPLMKAVDKSSVRKLNRNGSKK